MEDAADTLTECTTVKEALFTLSNKHDEDITSDMLGKAFKRHGYNVPSDYLSQNGGEDAYPPKLVEEISKPRIRTLADIVDTDKDDTEPHYVEPEVVEDWDMEKKNKCHMFTYRKAMYKVPFDMMDEMVVLRSDVHPGMGMSAGEIAQVYHSRGKMWVTEKFVDWMFKKIGFVKRMSPIPPHRAFGSKEALIRASYNRVDGLMKEEAQADMLRRYRTDNRNLRKKLRQTVEDVKMLDEANLYESEVRDLKYDGWDSNSLRTRLIFISDLHNGKLVGNKPLSKPQNIFNQDVFWERMEMIGERIRNTADLFGRNYDRVHIAGLGDYFEALLLNMRQFQFMGADEWGIQQYAAVKDGYISLIKTAAQAFDCPVRSIIQGGNHDRYVEDKSADSEELLAFQLADGIAEHFRHDDNVDVSFGSYIVSVMLPGKVNLITVHGHKKGLSSHKDFSNFIQLHGYPEARRYIVGMGHWHTFELQAGYNFFGFKNPSVCGDDRYNLEKLGKACPPQFVMMDVGGSNDIEVIGPKILLPRAA